MRLVLVKYISTEAIWVWFRLCKNPLKPLVVVAYEIYAVNDKFHLLNGFLWINLDAWQTFPCPPAPTQQVQQGSQGQAGGQDYHPGHHRGWDNHPCCLKGIKHTQQFPLTKSYNKKQRRVLWWYQILPLASILPPTSMLSEIQTKPVQWVTALNTIFSYFQWNPKWKCQVQSYLKAENLNTLMIPAFAPGPPLPPTKHSDMSDHTIQCQIASVLCMVHKGVGECDSAEVPR